MFIYVYYNIFLTISETLLGSISKNLPQHTPKTCKFCTKEEKENIMGRNRFGYKDSMCAISSINPHHHDVCGGDSGGMNL